MTPTELHDFARIVVDVCMINPRLSKLTGPDLVAVLQSASGTYAALTGAAAMQVALAEVLRSPEG